MARFRNRTSNIVLIVAFVLIAALAAGLAVAFVKLNKQETTKTLSSGAYSIGALDDVGEYTESTASIYTKNAITVDGLKCELDEDAKIQYKLYYFSEDDDGEAVFVSATEWLTADLDTTTIPETAKTAKIVIQPTADAEVSWSEISRYAGLLEVTYNK